MPTTASSSRPGAGSIRLIDTHAHLELIDNLAQALAGAKSAGVIAIIAVGSDFASNQEVLRLARVYQGFVYPALGLHPWNLGDALVDRDLEFIEANVDKAVAIGEVGLDYHKKVRAVAEKDRQKGVLKEILKIASRHGKPALVHSRYAWRDSLDLIVAGQLEKAVFHWFTGPSSVLSDLVGYGFYLSATPAVAYHEEHRRAVKGGPWEKLLLETDSPVVYGRGRDFEYEARPASVLKALAGVAGLRGTTEAEVADITTGNALRVFGLSI